jgi:ribosomal protein S18 acetylase RimI-like enzyme
MRKKFTLNDGTILQIEPLTGKEDAREFQRFINTITREKTYLLVDKPISLKQEKQWLQNQINDQQKGQQIYLKALVKNRLIGDCFARPGFGRNHGNISLGIALVKKWRGKGVGYILLTELIDRSEKKWHPQNLYLHVVSANTPAYALYESLGFRKIAKLPKWFEYENNYLDEYLLLLDKHLYRKKKNSI